MKALIQIVFLGLLLTALYLDFDEIEGVRILVQSLRQDQGELRVPAEEATGSISYRVMEDGWLSFPLLGIERSLKLVSNATIGSGIASKPDQHWSYALEYALIGEDGQTVKADMVHFRTQVTLLRVPGSEEAIPNEFVMSTEIFPTDGQVLRVSMESYPTVKRLQVRWVHTNPAIVDVLLRVYSQLPYAGKDITTEWEHYSPERREQLARGNLYPPELLYEFERQNLLENAWQPLGPLGLPGRDYETVRVYLRDLEGGVKVEPHSTLLQELVVDRGRDITIPVPVGESDVRIVFSSPADFEVSAAGTVKITWYGEERLDRETYSVDLDAAGGEFRVPVSRGLLHLEADAPFGVRAFQDAEPAPLELTPEPTRLRVIEAGPLQSLEYPVRHASASSTLFRLDIRTVKLETDSEGNLAPGRVSVEFRDAGGVVINSAELSGSGLLSTFETVAGVYPFVFVSEPVSRYFRLPPEVASVVCRAGEAVLLAAYNRPDGMTKVTEVPMDYTTFQGDRASSPVWYPLWPEEYASRYVQGGSVLLELQARPPEDNEYLRTGEYVWESFQPGGDWRGHFLLVPRDPRAPLREEALAATFSRIPAGEGAEVNFAGLGAQQRIAPTLLYLENPSPVTEARVVIDGQVHWRGALAGARGEVSLPSVPVGASRLRLDCGAVKGYLNYLREAPATGEQQFSKMMALRLTDRALLFEYPKASAGEEVVSFKLFAPLGAEMPTEVRVRVGGVPRDRLDPASGLTLSDRLYTVWPAGGDAVAVLHESAAVLDEGQSFYFPLAEDLPPGPYPIRFQVLSGPAKYLLVYRTLPGSAPSERRVYREPH